MTGTLQKDRYSWVYSVRGLEKDFGIMEFFAHYSRLRAWMLTWLGLAMTPFLMAEPLVYEGTSGFGRGKHIVFIANDHEYRSEQVCPALAKIMAYRYGFKCTVIFGLDETGAIMAGAPDMPGTEALADADLLFFATRFMNLPDEQVQPLVDYFERGGPTVGIRTSTHCFNGQEGKWAKLNFNFEGSDYLGGLGEQIYGNTWHKDRGQSHYGSNHRMGARIDGVSTAIDHPILTGVGSIHAYSGAYLSRPPVGSTPLLEVQVLNTFEPSDDINTEKPIVNAGWTRDHYVAPSGSRQDARVAYASYGTSEDLLDEDARRFLINASLWALGMETHIEADLDVDIVGGFDPLAYCTGMYYKGVKPHDLAGADSRIMPADAELAGLDQERVIRRLPAVLMHRPELAARIKRTHPELVK
ncbi:MAG: hypothetical protein SynsKO_12570 [Synoicihabitans sp.]